MELRTHRLATMALYTSLFMMFKPPLHDAIPAFLMGLVVDQLLDMVGHEYYRIGRSFVVRRSKLHSLHTLIVYLAFLAVLWTFTPFKFTWMFVACALVLHYILDIITESGIPVVTSDKRIKVRVSFRYNDPSINNTVIFASSALILFNAIRSIASGDPLSLLVCFAALALGVLA